jgi:outer membrane protein
MTDAQKGEKQKEFQQRADVFQKMVSDANQDIAAKDKEFAAKSIAEIRKIIAEVAKEMNISIVLEASESGLLYADGALDLTRKVLERYDAKSGK